jgi:gliding motility-associated-like protein
MLIPNLVISNQDGLNETFFIRGIQAGTWSLEIIDRWGKLVFNTDAYQQNWPGNLADPPGIYFYRLKNLQVSREYRGWLTLSRE